MPRADTTFPLLRARHERNINGALIALFGRLRTDALARVETGARTIITEVWDARLAAVIFDGTKAAATDAGRRVVRALEPRAAQTLETRQFDPDLMDPWLTEVAGNSAENINDALRDDLDDVDVEDAEGVFDHLLTAGVAMYAASMVNTAVNFGSQDAARAAGGQAKTWRVTSGNPRASHAAMDGETVALRETFSNGMRFPGDPAGGTDEVANCQCSLDLVA